MNALARARRYRDWTEESVALAKAAISNEMRAPVKGNYAQTHQPAESAGMPEVWHGDDAHSRCAGRT